MLKAGRAVYAVRTAESAAFLNECLRRGVRGMKSESMDALTLRCEVKNAYREAFLLAAQKTNAETELLLERGFSRLAQAAKRRFGLCIFAAAGFLTLFALSLFIWEIDALSDSPSLTPSRILTAAEEHGLGVGSFWPGLHADMLAAELLPELPGAASVSVNIHGSRAELIVTSAREKPEMQCEKTPADMTARIGGTIEEITAWEGTACVRVGDRVCAGDVLIRGVRGGTLSPALGVRARGRVRAETLHTISACAPKTETVTKPSGRKTHALSLTAGKRELFFSKSSRNFDSSCDIVRKNYALALPGVYRLPLALRFDTCEELLSSETQADAEETESALRAALLRELSRRLDGRGELREARYTLSETPELIVLTLHAVCIEEIGDTETKAG